ncbi:restriction endonuclease subunit S [Enterobacter bugandensis]|uniref:restriction endonuclease subunit S n=1 Tax=Enterobacter bugandensis TaxID=881260 RepID=UPI002FD8037D
MSGSNKHMLVPQLRFPEFRNAEEWTTYNLGQLSKIVTERVGNDDCIPYTITSGVGLISQQEKLGRTIAGNSLKNYILLQHNDFAYNKSATKAYPQGYIACYQGHERAAVPNSIFTCFRPTTNLVIPAFLDNLFIANLHGKWLKNRVAVGARANGALQVNNDDLMKVPVPLPIGSQSLSEQKKIADCLSSLDDLLTAEVQKLDALKKYKKGLLQQLFTREGETVPRLRFREFQNATEWERKTLEQLGELVSGLTYSPNDVRENGLLVLRSSNVQDGRIVLGDNVYVRIDIDGAKPSLPNDILICVRNGSKSLIGKNALIPEGMPPCTHGAFMTIFRSNSAKFMIQLFQTTAYENQVAADLGATINSINGNQLKKYTFLIPKQAEQKAVADFLTSLDELTAAQAQRIEVLKTHKRGLVQQLFPVLNEVPA